MKVSNIVGITLRQFVSKTLMMCASVCV